MAACRRLMELAWRSSLLGVGGSLQASEITRRYGTKQESKLWQQKPNRNPRLGIILTEDVQNLGVKGQMVKVKRGYGRNYLLPRKMAVYATPENVSKQNAFEVEETGAKIVNTDVIVDFLSDKTLCVRHDPNDNSAIFEQHISMAFHDTLQLHVPLDCVELEEPITDFDSEHSVGVRVDDETVVMVPVVIQRTLTKKKQRRLEKMERFRKRLESRLKV